MSGNMDTKSVITRTVSVLTLIAAMLGVIGYFNSNYVSKAELNQERSLRNQQEEYMQTQFLELAKTLIANQNLLAGEIRDAKAYGLIVKRDILQSRIELSPQEEAELRIIQNKLQELNVQHD